MEDITLDSYTKNMNDQELKGIVLKLKNELRKPDASWDAIRPLLYSLYEKDARIFADVAVLIIR